MFEQVKITKNTFDIDLSHVATQYGFKLKTVFSIAAFMDVTGNMFDTKTAGENHVHQVFRAMVEANGRVKGNTNTLPFSVTLDNGKVLDLVAVAGMDAAGERVITVSKKVEV